MIMPLNVFHDHKIDQLSELHLPSNLKLRQPKLGQGASLAQNGHPLQLSYGACNSILYNMVPCRVEKNFHDQAFSSTIS